MHTDLHEPSAAGAGFTTPAESSSVTVLMATYNGERHIRAQLDSVLRQTRLASEILIVDDASTDGTVAAAKAILSAAGVQHQVLVNRHRVGPWDNFLNGLAMAKCDLIAYCDQDDVWADRKLELCVEQLRDPDVLLVIHNAMLTDRSLRPIGILDQQIATSRVRLPLSLDPYVGPTAGWGNCMVFRREVATLLPAAARPQQPGEDRLLSHDTWIYLLCAALGKVQQLADPLTFYRQHDANVTVSAKPMSIRFSDHFRDPSPIYGRRARFYEGCRKSFSRIAASSTLAASWTTAAALAERRYSARAAFWNARVATYTAAGVLARLSAYAQIPEMVKQTGEFRSYASPVSRAKDLVNALVSPLRGSTTPPRGL